MQAAMGRVKKEGASFLDTIRKSDERIYLILLSLYVMLYMILNTKWSSTSAQIVSNFRYGLLSVIMYGSAIYLFFVIVEWKKLWKNTIALILIGGAIVSAVIYFSRRMSTNAYGVVFDVLFCLMACGKDYRKILRCVMCMTVVMLIVAGLGVPMGYTWNIIKPDNVSPGNSLGIVYPNTWGYIAFLPMMILWYLYLRHKPIFTFGLFWAMSLFMYFYISCRTVAVLTIVFPVAALAVDALERYVRKREERKAAEATADETKLQKKVGVLGWIITAMPFLAFAFMLYVSMQYEWIHKHFYNTALHTFAMRFVQGGLYFTTYGLPIFGNPYRSSHYTYINVNGTFEEVGILDSSFAAYSIMRGMFWMAYTLAWLSYAIYKALKRRDFAIPFLVAIILVFAMMERPGLEMWYNFILLYPLAKVREKMEGLTEGENSGIIEGEDAAAPDVGMAITEDKCE